jgi:hypothetical protein
LWFFFSGWFLLKLDQAKLHLLQFVKHLNTIFFPKHVETFDIFAL